MFSKNNPRIIFLFLVCLPMLNLLFSSCNHESPPAVTTKNFGMMDDTIVKYNRGILKTEDIEIADFIKRYQWKMQTSPSGLRYLIYKQGQGQKATTGKLVTLNYTVRLLDGTLCYSSDRNGPKQFTVGHGGVESGLEEGILLLKVGDRAKFILPSHLAFGLLGDQHKIPQNACLVYDVEVMKIQ
jgi:FKBP-type peptidyl-prolyl cis-trans isomerase FkpA